MAIHGIGIHGEGIGKVDGYTLFIEGALPGEIVIARLIECHRQYGRAQIIAIEKPSPDRAQPPCVLFGRCGGCQLMHLSYPRQLEIKRQLVTEAFALIGKGQNTPVEPCLPAPMPLAYRNKIQLPAIQTPGGIVLGLYEKASHTLIPVAQCATHSVLGETVYQTVSSLIRKSGMIAYDPDTGQGELRHILIKSTLRSQEALVILVTTDKATDILSRMAIEMMALCPHIRGVVHNQHTGKDNVILGTSYTLLQGRESITETLCGLCFQISAASFFQVNPDQAERLYAKALAFAALTGTETVLDAYCGVGTLSLVLAQKAKSVIGIEKVPEAIENAKANALLNAIHNVQFLCTASETFMKSSPAVDVVLLNPPRKGCEPSVLEGICRTAPQTIVYISCNPATLARDCAYLTQCGYRLEQVQPFDMFPQTAHVECVAKLTLRDCLRDC